MGLEPQSRIGRILEEEELCNLFRVFLEPRDTHRFAISSVGVNRLLAARRWAIVNIVRAVVVGHVTFL